MAGNVYVFNATPNQVDLYLNNHGLADNVAGVALANQYTPSPNVVQRISGDGNPDDSKFGGKNTLVVSFAGGGSQTYAVPIDAKQDGLALKNDLQLYIFYNDVVLVTPSGSGQIQGQETDAAMLEELQAQA